MEKYINPFTDWSFKRLFGQEANKDLLIDFLNELLKGEQHIVDVLLCGSFDCQSGQEGSEG